MNKNLAKQIGDRVVELTKDAIKKEFGLDVSKAGGSYDFTEFKMKLSISEPLKELPRSAVTISEEHLRLGLAERGTVVIQGAQKYVIVSAKRTKYVVDLIPSNGKKYVVPFRSVRLADISQ